MKDKDTGLPKLDNCPFCACEVWLELDAESPNYELGDSGYETVTITGEHDEVFFACPMLNLELMINLQEHTTLEHVANAWNRRSAVRTLSLKELNPSIEAALAAAINGTEQTSFKGNKNQKTLLELGALRALDHFTNSELFKSLKAPAQ